MVMNIDLNILTSIWLQISATLIIRFAYFLSYSIPNFNIIIMQIFSPMNKPKPHISLYYGKQLQLYSSIVTRTNYRASEEPT